VAKEEHVPEVLRHNRVVKESQGNCSNTVIWINTKEDENCDCTGWDHTQDRSKSFHERLDIWRAKAWLQIYI